MYVHAEAGDLEGVAALYMGMRARGLFPNLYTFMNLFLARTLLR